MTIADTSAVGAPIGADSRRAGAPANQRINVGRWTEPIAVAGVVGVYIAVVALVIARAPRVYLPADAAHALGEADQLLGRGVLDFAHPPAFAALVVVTRGVPRPGPRCSGGLPAALMFMWVAVYVLLRQWSRPVPSLVGTATGMSLPLIGELLGWGGGAQLLGIAFGVATLAAFERWTRRGRGGALVGVGVGLSALAHTVRAAGRPRLPWRSMGDGDARTIRRDGAVLAEAVARRRRGGGFGNAPRRVEPSYYRKVAATRRCVARATDGWFAR